MMDLDVAIRISEEFQKVLAEYYRNQYSHGFVSPSDVIDTCEKLKILGMNFGDALPSGDFRIRKGCCVLNPALHDVCRYVDNSDTYYIEWDNGNVGQLQFVNGDYYDFVENEWKEFLGKMRSYNPVEYDKLNCHIVYDIESGKRVMQDYSEICRDTRDKMRKAIQVERIRRKEVELEKLKQELV